MWVITSCSWNVIFVSWKVTEVLGAGSEMGGKISKECIINRMDVKGKCRITQK